MDHIDSNWVPTLQESTLIKVSTLLWNTEKLRNLAGKPSVRLCVLKPEPNWEAIDDTAAKLFSQFPFPVALQERMKDFLKIIGYQIMSWIEFHQSKVLEKRELPKHFIFTSRGLINKMEHARQLVANQQLPVLKRFEIACIYCFETSINSLWEMLQSSKRKRDNRNSLFNRNQLPIVRFWTYRNGYRSADVTGRWSFEPADYIETSYEKGFKLAVNMGNEIAVQYFLSKFSPEWQSNLVHFAAHGLAKRENSFLVEQSKPRERWSYFLRRDGITLHEDTSGVFLYLLSLMTEEKRANVISMHPQYSLKCLQQWPARRSFLKVAESVWDGIPEEDRFRILRQILAQRSEDFLHVFDSLWQKVPLGIRQYVSPCFNDDFWMTLLEYQHSVKFFLQGATEEERKDVLFSSSGQAVIEELVYKEMWTTLKLFIGECIVHTDTVEELKGKVISNIVRNHSKQRREKEQDVWEKIFEFLDGLHCKDNDTHDVPSTKKRRVDEVTTFTQTDCNVP